MKKNLKNAIVPHEGNDYRPHLLRRTGVLVVLVFSVAVFTFGFLERSLLFSDRMLATIYPTLVATLSNKNREDVQLPDLKYSPVLEEAARRKAEDMVIKGYFAHVSPDGVNPWHWITEVGYNYEYAGENLAINFSDSADVTKAWMESPGHRANILSPHFTEIGVATVKGYIDGRQTVFVVQMFGSPSPLGVQIAQAVIATSTVATSTAIATSTPLTIVSSSTSVLGLATNAHNEGRESFVMAPAGVYTALSLLVSNPRMILLSIYWVLAVAVVLSLTLLLLFFRRRHVPHILYGFCILVWIFACALLYLHFFGAHVILTHI